MPSTVLQENGDKTRLNDMSTCCITLLTHIVPSEFCGSLQVKIDAVVRCY